jgi:hypothetical protein
MMVVVFEVFLMMVGINHHVCSEDEGKADDIGVGYVV